MRLRRLIFALPLVLPVGMGMMVALIAPSASGSCAAPAGGAVPSGQMTGGQLVVWLEQQGIQANGAAGIAGNAMQENPIPGIPGGISPVLNSGGLGIFQWTGSRQAAVIAYAAQHGVSAESYDAQLGYLMQDLHGPYSGLLATLQHEPTPEQAADDFEVVYEAAGIPALTNRERYAVQALAEADGAGTVDIGGGGDCAGGAGGGTAAALEQMATAVEGTPYSTGGHATAFTLTAAELRASSTDCSGFVSWLMGPQGLGIWTAPLATPSIPSAPGLQPGPGQAVTLWNDPGAGQSGHVWVQFGDGRAWEEGGSEHNEHEMTPGEIAYYMRSGRFSPFHITNLG